MSSDMGSERETETFHFIKPFSEQHNVSLESLRWPDSVIKYFCVIFCEPRKFFSQFQFFGFFMRYRSALLFCDREKERWGEKNLIYINSWIEQWKGEKLYRLDKKFKATMWCSWWQVMIEFIKQISSDSVTSESIASLTLSRFSSERFSNAFWFNFPCNSYHARWQQSHSWRRWWCCRSLTLIWMTRSDKLTTCHVFLILLEWFWIRNEGGKSHTQWSQMGGKLIDSLCCSLLNIVAKWPKMQMRNNFFVLCWLVISSRWSRLLFVISRRLSIENGSEIRDRQTATRWFTLCMQISNGKNSVRPRRECKPYNENSISSAEKKLSITKLSSKEEKTFHRGASWRRYQILSRLVDWLKEWLSAAKHLKTFFFATVFH